MAEPRKCHATSSWQQPLELVEARREERWALAPAEQEHVGIDAGEHRGPTAELRDNAEVADERWRNLAHRRMGSDRFGPVDEPPNQPLEDRAGEQVEDRRTHPAALHPGDK